MTELAASDYYVAHSALTEPGHYGALIGDLPLDIPTLCRILHGLLIHEAWIERNGLNRAAFLDQSRTTLSVAQRLKQLLAIDPRPLNVSRPGKSRALGTCRDYSLMLCGVLRHHGVPARVRCGFCRYFTANPYQDHWVCEYWDSGKQRWILVDAQLDELHRNHLKLDFDPTDVPRTEFITGVEAWKLCRDDVIDHEQLGHGTTTGLFFASVNLARDMLALAKIETSEWDTWRTAVEPHRTLDDEVLSRYDRIAERGGSGAIEIAPLLGTPPWQPQHHFIRQGGL